MRPETDLENLRNKAQSVTSLLKVMSNESRLLILCYLAEGRKSVSCLQKELDLSQPALSQHLAVLRSEKLVATERQAQSIYYSLDSDDVKVIMGTLYDRFCAPSE